MELSYYVYNNLRSMQDHMKSAVYRFDYLNDAITKYNELPAHWTTALGLSLDGTCEVDIVHRIEGENALVNDYKNLDKFKNNPIALQAINETINKMNIQYEMFFEIHPNTSILSPIPRVSSDNSYFNNKLLNTKRSEINEVYVEGKGWLNFKDFCDLNKEGSYYNPHHPKVSFININYIEESTGYTGQGDLLPSQFLEMKQRTLDFNKQHKPSLQEQIQVVAAKNTVLSANNNLIDISDKERD